MSKIYLVISVFDECLVVSVRRLHSPSAISTLAHRDAHSTTATSHRSSPYSPTAHLTPSCGAAGRRTSYTSAHLVSQRLPQRTSVRLGATMHLPWTLSDVLIGHDGLRARHLTREIFLLRVFCIYFTYHISSSSSRFLVLYLWLCSPPFIILFQHRNFLNIFRTPSPHRYPQPSLVYITCNASSDQSASDPGPPWWRATPREFFQAIESNCDGNCTAANATHLPRKSSNTQRLGLQTAPRSLTGTCWWIIISSTAAWCRIHVSKGTFNYNGRLGPWS